MKHLRINTILLLFITLSLLTGSFSPLKGQSDTVAVVKTIPLVVDEVRSVDFRIPQESEIDKYRNDKRFDYVEKKKAQNWAWYEKFRLWLKDIFDRFNLNPNVENPSFSFEPLFWIFLVVLIILIVVFIFKFFNINPKTLFGKKKMDAPDISIYTEDVNEMNFDILIANAIASGDYRLGTRYSYLSCLKNMSDKSIITWKPNKTNYSYQYEIGNTALRSTFVDSTYIFEYVWYGEFPLDESLFGAVKDRLDQLKTMIDHEK